MKKLIISGTGFPGTNETLQFLNESAAEASEALAQVCGDKTIVSGVVVAGVNCTPGFITYQGELIYFEGGNLQAGVKIETLEESANYNQDSNDLSNVVSLPAYISKKAVFSNDLVATFLFADLKRLKTLRELADVPPNALTFLKKGSVEFLNVDDFAVIDVNFASIGTSAYTVLGTIRQFSPDDIFNLMSFTVGNLTDTGFKVIVSGNDFAGPSNVHFDYVLTPNN